MAESPASGLTDPKRSWLQKALGVVSEAVNGPPQAGFKDPSIPPPLPKLTGDEAAADLQRRLAKAGPTYEQLGKPGGDASFTVGNQLSGPETRLGQTNIETNRSTTTTKADGTTSTVETGTNGSNSTTTFDERGITVQRKSSVSTTWLGDNGKANEFTIDRLDSTNIGVGNVTVRKGDRVTDNEGDKTTITSKLDSQSVDLAKGDYTRGNINSTETRDEKGVTTRKDTEKSSQAYGLNGYTTSTEKSVQTDKTLSSTGSVVNVGRSPGMLGVTGTFTAKNNAISGKGENAAVGAGTEEKIKAGAGIVSDAKGTGVGANSATSVKTTDAAGKSLEGNYSSGGKYQSLVKEVAGSDPPRFTITTTISFDASFGGTGGYDTPGTKQIGRDGDDGGERPGGGRVGASIGGAIQAAVTASFKHELEQAEAEQYIDYVKANGRGSKLPEHLILVSGLKDGWDRARDLWHQLTGSAQKVKELKPGEEIESSVTVAASGKAGINAAEKPVGGLSGGVEVSGSTSHTLTFKKTGMPDGTVKVTASIDDSQSAGITGSAAYGAISASHGETSGSGHGTSYSFILDPKAESFDHQLAAIQACRSAEGLAALAKDPAYKVDSRTTKESDTAGSTDTVGVAGASIGMATSNPLDAEQTTDADGNVTGSKVTGTNSQTLSAGLGDSKLTMSDSESFSGQVKGDEASGEIARAHGESNLGKSIANALHNPLGVALNPGKTAIEKVDTEGTSFNDAELMSICTLALDKRKWNSQVGGRAQKDWVLTGAALRAATSQDNDGKLTYDRATVTRALAEWTKEGSGDRTKILERVYRPLLDKDDATPKGKAFAIPDTLEYLKPEWDALVATNALPAVRTKLATDPKGGLEDLDGMIKRLKALRDTVKSEGAKFEGMEIQQAEMLGHINSRLKEVNAALKAATKALPKPDAKPATEDDAIVERAQEKFAALDEYLDNVSQLEKYKKTLFGKLWQAEEKLKETSILFGGNKVEEAMPLIYQTADLLKLWDKLYDETDAMRKKLSQQSKDLETELRELHPKGGHDRWNEVNKAAHKY